MNDQLRERGDHEIFQIREGADLCKQHEEDEDQTPKAIRNSGGNNAASEGREENGQKRDCDGK